MSVDVSVVVATHNRPARLVALLDSMRAQTLPRDRYEVIVVDDGSADPTPRILADASARQDLRLTTFRQAPSRGPAAARNVGLRAARGRLVAFTDDDCTVSPGWLEGMLAAHAAHPWAVIQGRIEINPAEMEHFNPLAHTMESRALGPGFATANIAYPRELLEQIGGFDEQEFGWGGEDTDLGIRALKAGAGAVYAPGAVVYHGVMRYGALKRLKVAAGWAPAVKVFSLHPEVRRDEGLHPELRPPRVLRYFWRYHHWLLARFGLAMLLPRRLGALRLALAAPYVALLTNRRKGPAIAPFLLAHDATEMGAIIRGGIRYRVFIV